MADLADRLAAAVTDALAATSGLEAVAAALGVAYLLLAIRQHRACWLAAFASTLLYTRVFWTAGLPQQAALQAFYVAMAAYGWFAWRAGAGRPAPPVVRAPWTVHAAGLVGVGAASALSLAWLSPGPPGATAVLDAATTWASVFATWLVARKVLENWAWWLVVDAVLVVLCWRQGLHATALLYAAYLALAVVGWRAWWRDWSARTAA
jgi:nicotinamide mononucleotide transporter